MKVAKGVVAVALTLGFLAFASPASATSFCVPAFFEGCPDNGTNQAVPSLQQALTTGGSDGQADTVRVAPGTYSQDTPFTATGSDDLTVTGTGRSQTMLSSTSSTGTQVVNVFGNSRNITMRDLAIVIPASFPNSGNTGSALVQSDDVFERVDVISKNDGSNGIVGITQGGTFIDVNLKVEAGGSFGYAFGHPTTPDFCASSPKKLIAEGLTIENADSGITANCPSVTTSVRNVRIKSTDNAIVASDGNRMVIENALIESGDGAPVQATSNRNQGDTELTLRHATVIAAGDETDPGILAQVFNTGDNDDVRVTVRDSVFSGFANPWDAKAPTGPAKGNTILSIDHSGYPAPGITSGDTLVTEGDGIVNAAPGFVGAGDYRLAAGSPLIDAGQPTGSSDPDLDGRQRPVDGNGDGQAIADIGAFEYQPPATCATDPALCPKDTLKPQISKVKFSFKKSKGGTLRLKVSEAARVNVTFNPKPKKKRKLVKLVKQATKAGPVVFKLGKKRLATGRYRLVIVATDAAGNRKKLVRKVRAG